MKVGILGYGEIGKSIYQIIPDAIIGTRTRPIWNIHFDILYICIPYQKNFIDIVNKHKADLIIIHSTVPVGTTEKISRAVHSPVRGKHPNLVGGLKTFRKYVGSKDRLLSRKAAKYLRHIGIPDVKILDHSRTTELGKILDTTYYGICIEYHRYANDLCNKYGIKFQEVMTDFNMSYNVGYTKLGMKNVVRPILYPPKGKIGGHCVRENTRFLKKKFSVDNMWKK